jgi:hypothetical protein
VSYLARLITSGMGVEKLNRFEKFKEGVEMANRAGQPGLTRP